MSFISDIIKKSRVFLKKAKLQKEPETVDIRINSLPEWLYKITLEDPQKLEDKINSYIESLQDIGKELENGIIGLNLNKIISKTVSAYKKEIVKGKKDIYITKLMGIKDGIASLKKGSLDEKRKELEKINKDIKDFVKKQDFLEKVLKEFYDKDIQKINADFSDLNKEISDFSTMFKAENDEKVAGTITLIENIEDSISHKKELKLQIKEIEMEIGKIKNSIYKLGDKLDTAKNTNRFQDFLKERNDLAGFEQNKIRKLNSIKPKFEKLFTLITEDSLVNEYKLHFEKAIINDVDFEILEKVKKIEDEEIKQWFLDNFEIIQKELINLNNKINSQLKGTKSYVIINEVEDLEERTKYYQEKLNSERKKKKDMQSEIDDLKLDDKKHKLYKDLMILTGYDVNVIYDESNNKISS